MNHLTKLAVLTFALLGTACQFNQAYGSPYSPPARPQSGQGQLVVFRPAGEGGGEDRVYSLYVDGKHEAEMLHGGYDVVQLAAGKHSLETSPDFTIRAWLPGIILPILPIVIYSECIADTTGNLDIELASGETKIIRFRPVDGDPQVQSASTASAELGKCLDCK